MNYNNKLGLGTVQFGIAYGISNTNGKTAPREVSAILEFAKKEGINLLDTASGYGEAEKVLGQNTIDNFYVVSKFTSPINDEGITGQLNRSLQNLNLNSLYGYLAHRPAEIVNHAEQWAELKELKNRGLIKKIGFSLNSCPELTALLDKGFYPDLIQVPYNYFDRRFEVFFKDLKNINCEIHSRSAFLQGLFFTNVQNLPAFFDDVKPIIKALQTNIKDLSSSLLNFVIQNPLIDKVIIGVENLLQLQKNIKGLSTCMMLPDDVFLIDEKILMPLHWPK